MHACCVCVGGGRMLLAKRFSNPMISFGILVPAVLDCLSLNLVPVALHQLLWERTLHFACDCIFRLECGRPPFLAPASLKCSLHCPHPISTIFQPSLVPPLHSPPPVPWLTRSHCNKPGIVLAWPLLRVRQQRKHCMNSSSPPVPPGFVRHSGHISA